MKFKVGNIVVCVIQKYPTYGKECTVIEIEGRMITVKNNLCGTRYLFFENEIIKVNK